MKKMYMAAGILAMAGTILTGGFAAGRGMAYAASMEQETEGGIRAEAPRMPGSQAASGQTADASSQAADGQSTGSAEVLTAEEEKAIEIALKDAGLTEADVTGIRVKEDRDDGRTVYEVEIYVDAEEYSYEIDPDTGAVLEYERETDRDYEMVPDDPELITKEEAAEIALAQVDGATQWNLRIKYELDDGQELYEGDIYYQHVEYEFEISARTGEILEWSQERD